MNTAPHKQKLENEKDEVESVLERIAEKDAGGVTYNPKVEDFGSDVTEFEDEEADEAEEFSRRIGITKVLNDRLVNINDALARIQKGTFGACSSCEGKLEEKLLKANPATLLCLSCKNKDE